MTRSDYIYHLFIIYSAFAFNYYYEKPVITMENIKLTESSHEKCHQKRRILHVILLRIIFTEITKSTELPCIVWEI